MSKTDLSNAVGGFQNMCAPCATAMSLARISSISASWAAGEIREPSGEDTSNRSWSPVIGRRPPASSKPNTIPWCTVNLPAASYWAIFPASSWNSVDR